MNSFRELQRIRKERQKLTRISSKEIKWRNADVWLSRFNHLAQIGILVAAVFGYFHTVVPLYEKAALDEALAKTQIELNSTQKKVTDSYLQLRGYLVSQLIFDLGAECTGLLISPDAENRQRGGLDIPVGECLRKGFHDKEALSDLTEWDRVYFDAELNKIADAIDGIRRKAISEYEGLPSKAMSEPEILPTPDKNGSLILEAVKRMGYSEEQMRRYQYTMALHSAQLAIATEYGARARDMIKGLNKLEWPAASPNS